MSESAAANAASMFTSMAVEVGEEVGQNMADLEEEEEEEQEEEDEGAGAGDGDGGQEDEDDEDDEDEPEDEEGYAFPIGPLPQQITNDLKSLDEMVRKRRPFPSPPPKIASVICRGKVGMDGHCGIEGGGEEGQGDLSFVATAIFLPPSILPILHAVATAKEIIKKGRGKKHLLQISYDFFQTFSGRLRNPCSAEKWWMCTENDPLVE